MENDVVTIEVAKKLKEKGFKDICSHYYRTNSKDLFRVFPCEDWNNIKERINAPFLSQVLKWLREEKKVHIQILFASPPNRWEYITVKMTNNKHCGMCANFASYEKAALAGIEYVLDNLI